MIKKATPKSPEENRIELDKNNRIDFRQFAPSKNISIPNLISCLRILLIPFIIIAYFQGKLLLSLLLVFISGLTDVIDGFIARRFNQCTTLGKVLDPIADKLTQLALGICLCAAYPVISILIITLVIKETLMLMWGLRLLKAGQPPFSARWWGKLATAAFYTSTLGIIAFNSHLSDVHVTIICVLVVALLINSMVLYYRECQRRTYGDHNHA